MGLPPPRTNHRRIDLVPNSSLPNFLAYVTTLVKSVEIEMKWEKLREDGNIHLDTSPFGYRFLFVGQERTT
jgi:hypothetical protein